MPVSFPLLVIRCEVGNPPRSGRPASASYRALFGPSRPGGVLAFWEDTTYGYYDFRGSVVTPLYRIATEGSSASATPTTTTVRTSTSFRATRSATARSSSPLKTASTPAASAVSSCCTAGRRI